MDTLNNYLTTNVEGKTIVIQACDALEAIEQLDKYATKNGLAVVPSTFTDIDGQDAEGYTVRCIGTAFNGYPGVYVIGENDSDLGDMLGMKYADDDHIMSVARQMAEAFGSTSTLPVKNNLRRDGYYITQKRVSAVLRDRAADHGMKGNFNGTFVEYSLQDDANSPTATTVKVRGRALLPTIEPFETSQDSWEVNTVGQDDYTYYDAAYTSDEVRNSFAKQNGTRMQLVRARRCERSKIMTF